MVLEEEEEMEPDVEDYDEHEEHSKKIKPSSVAICGVGDTFGVAALVMLGSQTRQYSMWTSERSLFVVISRDKLVPFLETHVSASPLPAPTCQHTFIPSLSVSPSF